MPKNQRRLPLAQNNGTGQPPSEKPGLADATAWGRPSVTFRLTQERRQALLALTPELGLRPSPTAAIDFAIERAAGLGAASLARAEDGADEGLNAALDLRAVLAACAALRADAEQARAAFARVEIRLTALGADRETFASARPADESESKALTLGAWLNRQAPAELAWAVVKARWIGAKPSGEGKMVARVDAWAAVPATFTDRTGELERLDIGPIGLAALSAFDSVAVLVCSNTPDGWTARIHALDAQGKLGPALDSFKA